MKKLYVNANFSRYQNENGSMLDIFKTTGANEFTFSYVIEKQSGTISIVARYRQISVYQPA